MITPAEVEDEEAAYGEAQVIKGEIKINDYDTGEDLTERHDLNDTIFIFRDDEILIHSYQKSSSW